MAAVRPDDDGRRASNFVATGGVLWVIAGRLVTG